jgi:hypothetical protein
MVVNAYNCSIQESSGFSPFEALFARKPTLVADVALKATENSKQEFIHELVKRSAVIRNIVNRNLELARERQKKYYDQLVRHSKAINVGDLVLIRNFVLTVGNNKAFEAKFLGPFRVIRKIGDILFEICKVEGKVNMVVHVNRIKKFNERNNVNQAISDNVSVPDNGPVRNISMKAPNTVIDGLQPELWMWLRYLACRRSAEQADETVSGQADETVDEERVGEEQQLTDEVRYDEEDALPPLESTLGEDTLYQSMVDRTLEEEPDETSPAEANTDRRTRYGRKVVPVDKFQAGQRK